MPRTRGHSGWRPTHQIIHSGVTYVTRPSGTTIYKDAIVLSGVTLSGANVRSSYGYPMHIGTAGVKVVSGVTKRGGASAYMTASGLGLSTITNLIVTASGGPTCNYLSVARPSTGAVTVFYRNSSGTTRDYGVSINYFAIGT